MLYLFVRWVFYASCCLFIQFTFFLLKKLCRPELLLVKSWKTRCLSTSTMNTSVQITLFMLHQVTWRTKIHDTNWMILEANFWIIFQNFGMLLASSFKSGLLTRSYLRWATEHLIISSKLTGPVSMHFFYLKINYGEKGSVVVSGCFMLSSWALDVWFLLIFNLLDNLKHQSVPGLLKVNQQWT